MSKQLLKKSLSLLETDFQIKRKTNNKQMKKKKIKKIDSNEDKCLKSIRLYEELHKNRLKYESVKDLFNTQQVKSKVSDRKQTKSESVFTDKDFKRLFKQI